MVAATAMFDSTVKKLKKLTIRSGVYSNGADPLSAVIDSPSCRTSANQTISEVAPKKIRARRSLFKPPTRDDMERRGRRLAHE